MLAIAARAEPTGKQRIKAEIEGCNGILGGRADEIGPRHPAGGAAIELADCAPARLPGAIGDCDALLILELADYGVEGAGTGMDGLDAGGAGRGGGGRGRREG